MYVRHLTRMLIGIIGYVRSFDSIITMAIMSL